MSANAIANVLFPTTVAGSLPKPSWLAEPNRLWAAWRLQGEELEAAKDDATILAVKLQEDAGIDIVADGSSVAVRDRKLATQDIYPLSQTPLRYLLSDRIDLLKDTNVVNVTADDVFVSVTIEEKQALIGTSRLMLMIGAKDGQLKQWTVTDPQGYDTTVAVYNLDSTKKLDPGLFKIDFTNYGTPPG